jgi:hypothetical protein
MTPQEQQLIDGLIGRIQATPATGKDQDADRYLHQHLDTVPDALYVLAQTVLVQQYGLNNAQQQMQAAQQQIADLQQQLDQASSQMHPQQKQGSFLSHLFGADDTPPRPPQPAYQPVSTGYSQPPYGAPAYAPPAVAQPTGYGYGSGGGFLRGALQTAAGVAAGEMMFQGMEDLFHGFGNEHRGYEAGYDRPGEVINKNYYGDQAAPGHREEGASDSSFYNAANDASRQDLSPDIEDRRGLSSTDTGNDASAPADGNSFDDSSNTDDTSAGVDDNSGYDDGSSSDDGGGYDDSSMGGDDGGSF